MEIQGLTPIDTLYEFNGLALGYRLSQYLIWSGYFVGLLIAGALLRLYYVGCRKGTFVDMAVYPIYVLVIGLLLWPIEVTVSAPGSETLVDDGRGGHVTGANGIFWYPDVGTVEGQEILSGGKKIEVPRVLAIVSAITDALQESLVKDLDRTLFDASFTWLRVAAVNQNSRILDLDLRRDLGFYLSYCYWPAKVQLDAEKSQPWQTVPLAGLPIDEWLLGEYAAFPNNYLVFERTVTFGDKGPVPCAELHRALGQAVGDHLTRESFHKDAVETFDRLAKKEGQAGLGREEYARFYRRRLLYNEIFVVGKSETDTVRYALPEFNLVEGTHIDLTYTNYPRLRGDSFWGNLPIAAKALPDVVASMVSAVSEWWTQKTIGPATYYRVSALAPWIYGMVTAFLLMLFPIAGLMAFWPQWWTAIVNFLKVFVSVKLWPILWGYLSGMIRYRAVLNPEDPNGLETAFGGEGMFAALAGMYVMAPVLSFLIISIASHAGSIAIGGAIGSGSQGSLRAAAEAVATGGKTAVEARNSVFSPTD